MILNISCKKGDTLLDTHSVCAVRATWRGGRRGVRARVCEVRERSRSGRSDGGFFWCVCACSKLCVCVQRCVFVCSNLCLALKRVCSKLRLCSLVRVCVWLNRCVFRLKFACIVMMTVRCNFLFLSHVDASVVKFTVFNGWYMSKQLHS